MHYKLRKDVIYRKYYNHGYITDNSDYRYFGLDNKRKKLGEKYVSASGAVMLGMLSQTPRDIDDIIEDLLKIFVGVDFETLKRDVVDFFELFVKEGFVCHGDTYESCIDTYLTKKTNENNTNNSISTEDCTGLIGENEFLRSIHIDVANACNERCIHCYIPNDCKKNIIDSSLFYKIIDEGLEMNIVHVTLSGGEPLLHPDFHSFLQRCREKNLGVNVLSNLTLLTDDIIEEMGKNPLLSVQTSLYSMNPVIHDSITKVSGSFKKTSEGILLLQTANIPVQISCPIMKQNKDSFVDVLHWGWNHNIDVVFEPQIFAAYDHSKVNIENRLSIEEVHDIIMIQMQEGYAQSLNEICKLKMQQKESDSICSICHYSFCITAEGKAFPCAGWQNNIIGDLNSQSVKDIWETSEKIQNLRNVRLADFKKCINCEDRGYCTVCMMWNANENDDSDPYKINPYRCKIASITHHEVEKTLLK